MSVLPAYPVLTMNTCKPNLHYQVITIFTDPWLLGRCCCQWTNVATMRVGGGESVGRLRAERALTHPATLTTQRETKTPRLNQMACTTADSLPILPILPLDCARLY
jgi:hypothetical protein